MNTTITNEEALWKLGAGGGMPVLVDPKTGRRLLACSSCDALLWYDAGEGCVVSAICYDCEKAAKVCDFDESTAPGNR